MFVSILAQTASRSNRLRQTNGFRMAYGLASREASLLIGRRDAFEMSMRLQPRFIAGLMDCVRMGDWTWSVVQK